MVTQERLVRVGVCVFVFNECEQFLLGKRKGSHGAGTWGLPGGHIEFGELVWEAAYREVLEETGIHLEANYVQQLGWTESLFEKENKHYITAMCAANAQLQQPKLLEPNKCEEWRWVTKDALPEPLFDPLDYYLLWNEVPKPVYVGNIRRVFHKTV